MAPKGKKRKMTEDLSGFTGLLRLDNAIFKDFVEKLALGKPSPWDLQLEKTALTVVLRGFSF